MAKCLILTKFLVSGATVVQMHAQQPKIAWCGAGGSAQESVGSRKHSNIYTIAGGAHPGDHVECAQVHCLLVCG